MKTVKRGPLGTHLVAIAKQGQYGHSRTPRNFYIGGSYCEYYWSHQMGRVTHQEWQRIAKLSERYKRFVHHMTEVRPQWQVTSETHYADNSVEHTQTSIDGRTRNIMVVGPHGDVCF